MVLRRFENAVLVLLVLLFSGGTVAQDFLPPEQAFQIEMTPAQAGCTQACSIGVNVEIAPQHYLYRERFSLVTGQGLKSLAFKDLPRGERKFDENLNAEIEALRGSLVFYLDYALDGSGKPPRAKLVSQGCADAGLCYPPQTIEVVFSEKQGTLSKWFDSKNDAAALLSPNVAQRASQPPAHLQDEASGLASRLSDSSAFGSLVVFFGLGLLLAFTPCSLPMLPILSSLVLGDSRTHPGRLRPLLLALVYVLGMALSYAILGVLAGLTGQSLVVALQQPAVLGCFAALLFVLGVALLMGYSLQMPAVVQSWIHSKTGGLQGGAFVPVFFMGALSALLLGPCVAPPLAGALLYIGQTGDAVFGGLALFMLALGMGLPLLALAVGASAWLPKVGPWMKMVSALFGFTLLALAVWVVTPVVPVAWAALMWALWAALVFAALYHGVPVQQFADKARVEVVCKALALLFGGMSLVYLIGFFSGAPSLLRPLEGLLPVSNAQAVAGQAPHEKFERVHSGEVAAMLRASGQPVMLEFYADWCVSCKEFELLTLSDAVVRERLSGFRLVQVDITRNTLEDQALLKAYRLFGPPAVLFFPATESMAVHQVIGFQNASLFAKTLGEVRTRLNL